VTALEPEARGLEVVLPLDPPRKRFRQTRYDRLVLPQVLHENEQKARESRRRFDGRLRIHDANLERAEQRVGPQVPVNVLRRLEQAGLVCGLEEMTELRPVVELRRHAVAPAGREKPLAVAREARVEAAPERRARGE